MTGVSGRRQRRYGVKDEGNLDFTNQVQRRSQSCFTFFPFSRANFTWVRSYVLCCFDFTQQVRRVTANAFSGNFDNMREDEGLADRATFVVDPQGIIQAIEVTAEGIGRDASDLLRKIKAAQYVASHPGEVCPAKWKEGEATLAPSLDLVGKI